MKISTMKQGTYYSHYEFAILTMNHYNHGEHAILIMVNLQFPQVTCYSHGEPAIPTGNMLFPW